MGSLGRGCTEARPRCVIHLAPGRYKITGFTLAHQVSLVGAGSERSVIEGPVFGLVTGGALSDLTVTESLETGVIVARDQAPEIKNCTIRWNLCTSRDVRAAGVYCAPGSSPILENCRIIENCGYNWIGGGVYCAKRSSPLFIGCTIRGNAGGGVYCAEESACTFDRCRIIGNGGTLHLGRNGIFYPSDGVGFTAEYPSSLLLVNTVIAANQTMYSVFVRKGTPLFLINCTIYGDGKHRLQTEPRPTRPDWFFDGGIFRNCILWGNIRALVAEAYEFWDRVSYCCIEGEGPWPGEGNINKDPKFIDLGNYNFLLYKTVEIGGKEYYIPDYFVREPDLRLASDSPCIDAGNSQGAPFTDIEGNVRPCGKAFDMGAYEFGGCEGGHRRFLRGDANADGALNLADALFLLEYLFSAGPTLMCEAAADCNDSGTLNLADVIYLLGYAFGTGPAPPEPCGACGYDPTKDRLGCEFFPPCTEP